MPMTFLSREGHIGSAGSSFEMKAPGSAFMRSISTRRASTRLFGASSMPVNWREYFQSIVKFGNEIDQCFQVRGLRGHAGVGQINITITNRKQPRLAIQSRTIRMVGLGRK